MVKNTIIFGIRLRTLALLSRFAWPQILIVSKLVFRCGAINDADILYVLSIVINCNYQL